MLQATSHGGEEEGFLQVKLEYMSGPEMPEEGPGEPKLGRHLLIPLRLHLLPSLQVLAPALPLHQSSPLLGMPSPLQCDPQPWLLPLP